MDHGVNGSGVQAPNAETSAFPETTKEAERISGFREDGLVMTASFGSTNRTAPVLGFPGTRRILRFGGCAHRAVPRTAIAVPLRTISFANHCTTACDTAGDDQ
jgi:hypothetical protein